MRNGALKLYIARKSGRGQSPGWKVRAALSTLLLLAISLALSFAIVFIESMATGLDEVLQLLGSGSLYSTVKIPEELLQEGERADRVQSASAIVYSATSTALVNVKGVDEDYFFPRRSQAIGLERVENTTTLHGIVISSLLAHELGVEKGERLALMIYDSALERVRPVYLFIEGTYSTGYEEFDSSLVFTGVEVTRAEDGWEIYTEGDVESLYSRLLSEGYSTTSYRQLYRSIYSNILVSVRLLDVIVVLIAFLAGFFAISIAAEYIERDRRDIALMMLSGVERGDMARCYVRITMKRVVFALAIGMGAGLALSYAFIPILSSLDTWALPALQSYVTNFSVRVPEANLLLCAAALLASAYLSLVVSMRRAISSLHGALVS